MVPRTKADAAAVRIPRRRFTIDEYHRMGEAGVLTVQAVAPVSELTAEVRRWLEQTAR